jgi:hypothetical protein
VFYRGYSQCVFTEGRAGAMELCLRAKRIRAAKLYTCIRAKMESLIAFGPDGTHSRREAQYEAHSGTVCCETAQLCVWVYALRTLAYRNGLR